MKPETEIGEGWTFLWNSPKWHYFREGRSLCGRFMLLGSAKLEADEASPDNCKGCLRKRAKETEKASA